MDFKLTDAGDLDVTGGELLTINDYDSIAQDLRIRLRTFLGEWFLDTTIGMPYFEEILVKNPNKLVIETRFRQAILETSGLLSVDSIQYDLDTITRNLTLTFTATMETGENFNFSFNEFILTDAP